MPYAHIVDYYAYHMSRTTSRRDYDEYYQLYLGYQYWSALCV